MEKIFEMLLSTNLEMVKLGVILAMATPQEFKAEYHRRTLEHPINIKRRHDFRWIYFTPWSNTITFIKDKIYVRISGNWMSVGFYGVTSISFAGTLIDLNN